MCLRNRSNISASPRDVLVICQGKSTYARCGLIVNVTPLEPEWEGHITISLVNGAPVPVVVHSGEGIGQAVFLRTEDVCRISYADRKGKYQGQPRHTVRARLTIPTHRDFEQGIS